MADSTRTNVEMARHLLRESEQCTMDMAALTVAQAQAYATLAVADAIAKADHK